MASRAGAVGGAVKAEVAEARRWALGRPVSQRTRPSRQRYGLVRADAIDQAIVGVPHRGSDRVPSGDQQDFQGAVELHARTGQVSEGEFAFAVREVPVAEARSVITGSVGGLVRRRRRR